MALIPSQTSEAAIWYNHQVNVCGYPPALVWVRIRFQYMFTAQSSGCTIGATLAQGGPSLLSISQTGKTPGQWYTYSGPAMQEQLSYQSLFTIQIDCAHNTPNTNAVLITNVQLYS